MYTFGSDITSAQKISVSTVYSIMKYLYKITNFVQNTWGVRSKLAPATMTCATLYIMKLITLLFVKISISIDNYTSTNTLVTGFLTLRCTLNASFLPRIKPQHNVAARMTHSV